MNPTIASAIITASGALIGVILTVYFNVIRKPQQAEAVAPDLKRLADQSTEMAGPILAHTAFGRDETVPFDSDLMFVSSGENTIIRMPRKKGGLFTLVFMGGWLIAWTAGIFAAGIAFVGQAFGDKNTSASMDWFGAIFIFGWLFGAIAAEFAVMNALFKGLIEAIGRRYLIIGLDAVTMINRVFGINIPKIYFRKNMKNFRAESDGVVFEYGKNDIKFDGITRVESDWVRGRLARTVG